MDNIKSKQIINKIAGVLSSRQNNQDAAFFSYLQQVTRDHLLVTNRYSIGSDLSIVYNTLLSSGKFGKQELTLKTDLYSRRNQPFSVILAPGHKLDIESRYETNIITYNDNLRSRMYLSHNKPEQIALWIIALKDNIGECLEAWDYVSKEALKVVKSNNINTVTIKALFAEAMKDYPELEYEVVEQKRRLRFRVRIPDTRLCVMIDAWWKSYNKTLPQSIADLKTLIETINSSSIKEFHITRKG